MPSPGDFHAFYAAAHHDTWWAKSQQWSAAGWAIALLGGVAGFAKATNASIDWMTVLNAVIGLGGVGYIARLHFDTIRARQITDKLRDLHPPLLDIAKRLPGWSDRDPDDVRGAIFPLLLAVAIAIAEGLSTYAVRVDGWAAGLAIIVLVLGFAFVACARAAA